MKEITAFRSCVKWDMSGKPRVQTEAEFEGGRMIRKTISFEDYKKLLFNSEKEDITYFSVDHPRYYYQGFASDQKGTFQVILTVPSGTHMFVSEKFKIATQLPYPALAFKLSFRKGTCEDRSCYALDTDTPNNDSALYRYPYGNVSHSGSICMGNISINCASIKDADKFVDAFFDGIDEGHYYEPGENTIPVYKENQLVKKVLEKGSFPTQWLHPMTKPMKLSDILFRNH